MVDKVIKTAAGQVCCDLDGEAVILSLKTGQYYGLDGVGARVWALIQEPKNVSDLLNTLLSEFDVEAGVCERDLWLLLEDLNEAGLVEIAG